MTGSWVALPDGRYIFMIETGERRFWAACLRAVRDHLTDEPLLRVEVIEHPTRQRQVLENRHAEPPSAVGQSCEVAGLILAELGIAPDPAVADEYDYFRQARAQRMPAGLWEKIMPIMQLTRPRMVQLLNILQLPTALLELADRYRLPERVLREVLSLPREHWERTLRTAIQEQLTADQVADMGARPPQSSAPHANPIGGAALYPGPGGRQRAAPLRQRHRRPGRGQPGPGAGRGGRCAGRRQPGRGHALPAGRAGPPGAGPPGCPPPLSAISPEFKLGLI